MPYLQKTRDPAFLYGANYETCKTAKILRRKMTRYEKIFWQRLRRNYILGVKFRRQHPIGRYIADFYCHEARLVIEIDGPIHRRQERREYDQNRTAELERLGIKVIRFNNLDITNKIKWVLQIVKEETLKRLDNKLQK